MRDVKAYKYKLKTNAGFVAGCSATLDICRELYNAALQERRDAYRINGLSINYHAQAVQLPQIKQVREDVGELHSQVLQDALRRVDKAFNAFFRRCRNGETPGYPRFKPSSRYDSFTYPQSGFRVEGNKLHLSKIGSCRLRLSRPIEGTIKTCTIKRDVDGWYVVFAVEENQCRFFPKTGEAVGIDVGVENFATLSTGEAVENPEFLRESESELKTAQRKVSRRKRGSKRRGKAVRLLGKKHQKIRLRRADFHHKMAFKVVKEFDAIAVEDLNIKGMVKNHHLAKSISDAGWSQFIKILTSKAESAGREVIKVNPSYTSQDCSGCGERNRITLATRIYRCTRCGLVIHRDRNGALNVKGRAGLSGMVPDRESCEPRIST
ncbi:MAG TPA: transposase [Blastocatellia bacterium]|nr:transposase [Blastocatellia bacterium]